MHSSKKILILNSPWINNDKEYGIKSGTRWAALRKKESTMPYWPYPYYMALAAAVLKQAGFDVYVKDAINEEMKKEDCLKYIKQLNPALIVIEPYTPSIYVDLDFAEAIKKNIGCLIALCGAHVTALPEEVLKYNFIDFVLIGEYEYTLRELCSFLAKSKKDFNEIKGLAYKTNLSIEVNKSREFIKNLDELPFPDFEQLPLSRYNEPLSKNYPNVKIVTSRGCPHNCIFCVEPIVLGREYRTHSIKYIIDMIKYLIEKHKVKEIYFDDAIFTIDRAKKIAQAIIDNEINIPWACWMHWNVNIKELKLLKKSGCIGIKFGVESANSKILKTANKLAVDIENIKRLVKDCKKVGLLAHGSFMLGLPGETKKSIQETIDLAFSLGLDICQFTIATPLPGTSFYKMVKENGWLITNDWSKFESLGSCVVNYPECSTQDILTAMEKVRNNKVRQFFKNPIKAIHYIWKLYKLKGLKGFYKEILTKGKFAIKAMVRKK